MFSIFVVLFGLISVAAFLGWLVWRSLKKSDDAARLICKWIVTAFLVGIAVKGLFPIIGRFNEASALMIIYLAAIAVVIGLIWAPSWATMLFKPLTSAFDGGDADGEITPQYSIAEARRARGQFPEAIAEIRKQLELFPNDLRLQLMQAEIQAEHLDDLQGAEAIISRISRQKHSQANIASAFHQLADWHLKIGNDPDSARQALERIIEGFPDSQFAQTASQRIAHLSSVERLLEHRDPHTIRMREYERDIGLKRADAVQESAIESRRAKELLDQLARHPLDNEAREELAKVYAEEYQRVELAVDELETLIGGPNQKPRDIIRWLNLAADLHIKVASDIASAETALRRIIEMFPNSAGAEMARVRLATLSQELNRNKKRQAIKLGVYEKDLGLKQRKPAAQ